MAALPDKINFAAEEEKILELWKRLDAFKRSLELTKDKPEYTFYDGPPFATGLPHYGHILAGTIKDIVTRYATQTGHYVSRRFGWDCHGLPVEYEIDKKLDIKGRDQVLAMGIDKYNAECRSIVTRYCGEWESIITRLGRWIDFKNDYKTMEPWYMESVWWVFKTIWEKGLVYRSFRVMPYSTACNTPLSNFEAGLNYKEDTQDPAVVVSFPISLDAAVYGAAAPAGLAALAAADASPAAAGVEAKGPAFVAWTTTPWTLPSNLALCVHPEFHYACIRDIKSGATYVMAENRIPQLYPKAGKKDYKAGSEFEVLAKVQGKQLVGLKYAPLFPYFQAEYGPRAFRVVADTYVTDDAGTGIVHQAPAFGEDDYRVCLANGIIERVGSSVKLPCPVDDNGRYTAEVSDYQGKHVKEADEPICVRLKELGRMVQKSSIVHSYPFCWRSETPLIYKAVPSWFVRVEEIKEKLLANNEQTYWVPGSIKEGRFHNWLRDARDWNISRNRYWGTPLPIWASEDGEEIVVIGSIAELEAATGAKVTDLHRESIDHLTIPSKQGKGSLKRIEEVFDCWFESGSMPYAQVHYPFENSKGFAVPTNPAAAPGTPDSTTRFPADFIAEGLDQTRGWFYTLMVLSTALFDKPAFKNLIVNGLVLAEDGKKMSKRLKNYPDPLHVVNAYGADALRLYLIDSPVVRAEPLRFKEAGVLGVVKDVFLPWYNALRFFSQNAARAGTEGAAEAGGSAPCVVAGRFVPSPQLAQSSTNAMDRWILAATQNLIRFVRDEMAAYRLYTVVPRLVRFIGQLTNWYVRLNRLRLKGVNGAAEAAVSLSVLHGVLLDLARLMAPFTPFLTETMYQHLRAFALPVTGNAEADAAAVARGVQEHPTAVPFAESVHFTSIPDYRPELLNEMLETRVERMQTIVELGRVIRERVTLSLKSPVRRVVVIHPDGAWRADVEAMREYIAEELNALEVTVDSKDSDWAVVRVEPDAAALGKKLGKDFKNVGLALKALSTEAVTSFMAAGSLTLTAAEVPGLAAPLTLSGASDVKFVRDVRPDRRATAAVNSSTPVYETVPGPDGVLLVALDLAQDESLKGMGSAREVINRVQKLRKRAGVAPSDVINVYVTVGSLTIEAWNSWQSHSAKAGAGEEAEEGAGEAGSSQPEVKAASAPAAGAKGGKGAAAGAAGGVRGAKGGQAATAAEGPVISIAGRAVSSNAEAIAGFFQSFLHNGGQPAGSGMAGSQGVDSTLAPREAAAAALRSAITSNYKLIRDTVRQPVLPDVPCVRAAGGAVPIAKDSDIIAGALLTITLTRAGPWANLPALEQAVSASATASTSAAPAAAAAVVAKTAASVLAARDYSALSSSAAASAGVHVHVDGVGLHLRSGVHYHLAPEAALAAHGAHLQAQAQAEGGDYASRMLQAAAAYA